MSYLDRPVFVCGAPRSGTTLLVSLLDGHERLIALPFEPVITEAYNRYRPLGDDALLDFFLRQYLDGHGVRSILDPEYQSFLEERTRERFGERSAIPRVAPATRSRALCFKQTFRRALLDGWTRSDTSLSAPHRALAKAYAEFVGLEDAELFVQRRPFVNEAQALRLKRAFPGALFIHIVRDPRTRYMSAKARRTYRSRLGFRRVRNVDGVDPATHRAVVSMASLDLARRNLEILGEDSYLVVKYEDCVGERKETMAAICRFLDIDFRDILLEPTRGGMPTSPNSSFKETRSALVRAPSSRLDAYLRTTTRLERCLVQYYCAPVARTFEYELGEGREPRSLLKLLPIRHEHPLDYVRNRFGSVREAGANRLHMRNRHLDRLLTGVERGDVPSM